MNIVLIIYLVGYITSLVALLFQVIRTLEGFDRKNKKRDIVLTIVIAPVLWPIALMFNPKLFIDPFSDIKQSSEFTRSLDDWPKRKAYLESLPVPKCSRFVKYSQKKGMYGEKAYGTFTFLAEDLEHYLREYMGSPPRLDNSYKGDMLKWVSSRNDNNLVAVSVPEKWWDFQLIANQLVKSSNVKIKCRLCNSVFETGDSSLKTVSPQTGGWNFDEYYCPDGHPLLIVETMHVSVRPKSHT